MWKLLWRKPQSFDIGRKYNGTNLFPSSVSPPNPTRMFIKWKECPKEGDNNFIHIWPFCLIFLILKMICFHIMFNKLKMTHIHQNKLNWHAVNYWARHFWDVQIKSKWGWCNDPLSQQIKHECINSHVNEKQRCHSKKVQVSRDISVIASGNREFVGTI